MESYSKNKFEKLVLLVGFIIRIYHDARSSKRQNLLVFTCSLILNFGCHSVKKKNNNNNFLFFATPVWTSICKRRNYSECIKFIYFSYFNVLFGVSHKPQFRL